MLFGGSPAARAQIALGTLLCLRGDQSQAEELQLAGLERAERDGDAEAVAQALEGVAASAARTGDVERAAVLLGAASSIRARVRVPRDAFEDANIAPITDALGSALGGEVLARAMAAGSELGMHDALEVARRSAVTVTS